MINDDDTEYLRIGDRIGLRDGPTAVCRHTA